MTKFLIISKDLEKELNSYNSCKNIILKLTTFKIDESNKYINITKKLLCNFNFLKLIYYKIRNINLEPISKKMLNNKNDKYKRRSTAAASY